MGFSPESYTFMTMGRLQNEMSTEISEAFTIIFVIHFLVAAIALASFVPSSDKTNKTYAQIKEDRKYADLLLLNFPFLLGYSIFLPTIPLSLNFSQMLTKLCPLELCLMFPYFICICLAIKIWNTGRKRNFPLCCL